MKTGILLIGFNRPEHLQCVFEAVIASAVDLPVIVHVDGADAGGRYAQGNNSVKELVKTWERAGKISAAKLQPLNLGCKYGPPAAISWGFELFEALIILEDDCIPDPSFFPYCSELLLRYRNDSRVGSIAGDNAYSLDLSEKPYSYTFISYPRIWGWATWRDRWAAYDPDRKLEKSAERELGYPPRLAINPEEERRMRSALQLIEEGRVSNWDTQWWSCFASNHWLCVQPGVNLIRNTGFGEGATHTTNDKSPFARLIPTSLKFPLKHPPFVRPDRELDDELASQYGWKARLRRYISRFL